MAAATTLPLLCDADTGFGEALNVERTVQAVRGGRAPPGFTSKTRTCPSAAGTCRASRWSSRRTMAAKIRAAVAARRDPDFVIIARTDARGVTGFDDAVQPGQALPARPGPTRSSPRRWSRPDEFAAVRRRACRAPLLANMTEFGKGPLLDRRRRSAAMGYRMVLYPADGVPGRR